MRTIVLWSLVATFLTPGLAAGQTLHLKTRPIDTSAMQPVAEITTPQPFGRGHLLLQFNDALTPATVTELGRRGVTVLQDVPDNGLLVVVEQGVGMDDLGLRFAAPLDPSDKVSPLITAGDPSAAAGFFLVEVHPDVDLNGARGLMLNLGIELLGNPDLNPHHLLIRMDGSMSVFAVAGLDEVAYIFPASNDLVTGVAAWACAGPITTNGTTGQSIPTYGDGWDGPGLGAAALSYVFSRMSVKLDATAAQGEIQRAMAEWSKAAKITWRPGVEASGPRTVNILFATGAHGDPYPFDGPGGVLAHTFYPAPPNPEPIAGDMHLDDAENWRIGVNVDLFSVTLHELGHALGLGHADSPGAVMYPYYKMVTALSTPDISAVQTLYAPQDAVPAPPSPPVMPGIPAAPLAITMNVPAAITPATHLNLSGAVSGGRGPIVVTWASGHGASGVAQQSGAAWSITAVPLAIGSNTGTVTATDGYSHVSQTFTVTRQAAPAPDPNDTTAPALSITSPTTTTFSTSAATVVFVGTASDDVAVTAVTWSTNTGSAGLANGLTNWVTPPIPIYPGSNTVTVRASDRAGNSSWRTVVVTRH